VAGLVDPEKVQSVRNMCHIALRDLTGLKSQLSDKQLRFGNTLLVLHSISKTISRRAVIDLFFNNQLNHDSMTMEEYLRQQLTGVKRAPNHHNQNLAVLEQIKSEETRSGSGGGGSNMPLLNPFLSLEYLKAMSSGSLQRNMGLFSNFFKASSEMNNSFSSSFRNSFPLNDHLVNGK
jgi:hypothetical protein